MISFDTPQEAIRCFLGNFMDNLRAVNARNVREVVRRYEVAGAVCQISRTYGRKLNYPRWRWLEPTPTEFLGVDMSDYIQHRYMVPWAVPRVAVEEPEPEKPTEYQCGVVLAGADTEYYADLLKKLQAKDLFKNDNDDETEDDSAGHGICGVSGETPGADVR